MKERLISQEAKEIPGILRIGVDIDGIVSAVYLPVQKLIKENLGVDILKDGPVEYWVDRWPEIQAIPGGPEFVTNVFNDPHVLENAPPIPGAISILNRLKKQGHQIWFISARHPNLKETTYKWLKNHDLSWAICQVILRENPGQSSSEFKRQIAQKLRLHIFIDDCSEYVRNADSAEMLVKILLKYPWNMADDAGPQTIFCHHWSEIEKIIKDSSCWHYFLNQ